MSQAPGTSKRPMFNVIVLSAALLIGAGPYIVRAAGTAFVRADNGAIANVDMQRVFAESDARKAAEQKIQEFGQKLGKNFQEISKLPYLTPEEVSDYSVALNAEKPTPEQTKKITDLQGNSAKRVTEAQQLGANKNLTQKDKDRMKELEDMQKMRPLVQDRLQKVYQQAVDEEEQKQLRLGMAEVRGIVSKLAKDQAVGQVYDATAMVYAPIDLTDQALKKTQTKKK